MHTFTRRSLLVDGVRLAAAVPLLSAANVRRFEDGAGERVLVVIQLSGANDGLNTVVPLRQDDYFRARPTLALAPKSLHRLDDDHGLHPLLGGLAGLASDGLLACLHGVGTPTADRSHFRSLEVWHTADPTATSRVGWLGRLADQLAERHPNSLPALAVGGRELVLSMRGKHVTPPTLPDDRGFTLARVSQRLASHRSVLLGERGGGDSDVEFLRRSAQTAYAAAERMQRIVAERPPVAYPDRPLARELQLVARLIAGGFGTRVFHASLGGFDTHASQASVHEALLRDVDGALTAFQRDLAASGVADRVTTFVFSEFGRRVRENGSRGTDHGHGGPALVLGGAVVPGCHGTPPDLGRLVDGDVPATMDFRAVHRRLEADWLGLVPASREGADAPRFLA